MKNEKMENEKEKGKVVTLCNNHYWHSNGACVDKKYQAIVTPKRNNQTLFAFLLLHHHAPAHRRHVPEKLFRRRRR